MSFILSGSEELRIYRGKDYAVNEHISIHIPTLGEIADYGEDEYFSLIQCFTQTPSDICYQLWDIGIDFTEVSDFQLFSQLTLKALSDSDTRILFGDFAFGPLILGREGTALFDPSGEWYIDELTFLYIAEILRTIHFFKRNVSIPANENTKMILIEDARDSAAIRKRSSHGSYLKNLVSAMINSEGFKYNHDQVWDMRINAFMDSVMRIGKIKSAGLLLQSGYSGFGVNLKKINQKELDWMGDLS